MIRICAVKGAAHENGTNQDRATEGDVGARDAIAGVTNAEEANADGAKAQAAPRSEDAGVEPAGEECADVAALLEDAGGNDLALRGEPALVHDAGMDLA